MDKTLSAMSLLPSVGARPMTHAAPVQGTAVSCAGRADVVLGAVLLGAAFGIDPGPPRGAPV
jgi:hypothetical protein